MTEYGSPHGGSWLNLLSQRGLTSMHDSGVPRIDGTAVEARTR